MKKGISDYESEKSVSMQVDDQKHGSKQEMELRGY